MALPVIPGRPNPHSPDPEFVAEVNAAIQAHNNEAKAAKAVAASLGAIQRNAARTGRISDASIQVLSTLNNKLSDAEAIAQDKFDRLRAGWLE